MVNINEIVTDKENELFQDYDVAGVYGIYLNQELVYIGSSVHCMTRFYQHKRKIVIEESKRCAWKDYTLVYNELRKAYQNNLNISFEIIDEIDDVNDVQFLRALERAYIRILKPKFNVSNH